MAEELKIQDGSKEEKYQALIPQVKAVMEGERDLIANMANLASMLHETFGFWWTGFYRVSEDELVLGPIWKNGKVFAVLDIDSKDLATFDETDKRHLEEIVALLRD